PVCRTDDEVAERVAAVQVDRVATRGNRGKRELAVVVLGWERTRCIDNDELDLHRAADDTRQRLRDQRPIAVVEPVSREAVWSGDAEAVLIDLDEGCVLEPGLEVGRRETHLELTEDGAPYLLRIHQ